MNEKFDEAYYQHGSERGTQYCDYLEGAVRNRTYFEIAQTIFELLRPRRTLEIGCATGVIVGHLQTFDVDAHGIDVSQWAVEHRVAKNVELGSAEDLPFPDDYFDVVYSVHALEHLTEEAKDRAFAELARVCSGFQFHMMPMLESGPYVGDRFGHLLNLRTDPTHNLLYEREWWIDRFGEQGFEDSGVAISITHDNAHYELSSCQLLMSRKPLDPDLLQRIATHNHAVAGALSLALNGKPGPGLDVHVSRLREQAGREEPDPEEADGEEPHREEADHQEADHQEGDHQQADHQEAVLTTTPLRRIAPSEATPDQLDGSAFARAKIEGQKRLIEDLRNEVERIPALNREARRLQRAVDAAERRCSKLEEDLKNRYCELTSLTRTLLDAEEEYDERHRTAERLQAILQAIMNERAWWRFMPGPWRIRRRARRLSRLGLFDSDGYAARFVDVTEGGQDPLRHYIFHGIDEIRQGLRAPLE